LGLLGLIVVHPEASRAAATRPAPPGAPVATPVTPAIVKLAVAPQVAGKQLIPAAPPNVRGAVPVGKGMWIWKPEQAEGANAAAIVAKAQRYGINYLYVRTGSSVSGFAPTGFLDALLPAAHAAGIKPRATPRLRVTGSTASPPTSSSAAWASTSAQRPPSCTDGRCATRSARLSH
jgi:hypothetical protein